MRLGPSRIAVLSASAMVAVPAAAQARPPAALPWDTAPTISWRAGVGTHADAETPIAVDVSSSSHAGPITVTMSADGTMHLVGVKGVRRLRMGLPGRPLRIWRDAGIPIPLAGLKAVNASWRFPGDTPLSKGIQALPWGGEDFRTALVGLLWIIDDGEHFITVVHPATARVIYLPLPLGQDFSLRMTPGYLELLENPREASTSAPRRWSLPWLALLPHFAKLARPDDVAAPGTAMIPFPNH